MFKKAAMAAGLLLQTASVTAPAAGEEPRPLRNDPVCAGNLSCRPLTPGEIRMAKTIFRDTVDYGAVRIYQAPYSILRLRGAAASAPDGNIYIHVEDLSSADYSKAAVKKQKAFIHEMTHVWQYQKGVNLYAADMALTLKTPFNYKANYEYKIDGRPFKEYSTEQQAKIAEDFFGTVELVRSLTGEKDKTIEAARILACQDLFKMKQVLQDHLPVKMPGACKMPGLQF